MIHADLAELLRHRLAVIADRAWYEKDPQGHLVALQEVSENIDHWHHQHRGQLSSRLEHFLTGKSFDKALRLLESDGQWTGH
ncbi:hypothetical protein HNR46_001420 [Haloferula luteola]|uniref:Uncharacterized protein n=1 Tax=Haloferula luteola TaxID=595692 RepID=A0A840V2B0_9BACT|nr:hypothetical protein [Haloferula luteola]MBB5351186.1 hypothetical protein [Haloferula luteola]